MRGRWVGVALAGVPADHADGRYARWVVADLMRGLAAR